MDVTIKAIVEAALFAADEPLSEVEILRLFEADEQPDKQTIRAAICELQAEYANKPMRLIEVASGFRFQVDQQFSPWISRLWEEKPARYSRALLETLAIIAYQQPVTRGEIEEIRGVAVSTNIIRTLQEREWVRVIGHKEVPGRPALYATTRQFLDYFNLKAVADLPTLTELKEIDLSVEDLQLRLADNQQTAQIQDPDSASIQDTSQKSAAEAV